MDGESSRERERVNVFSIKETYYFKHFFEGEDVFAELRQYYNAHQYRFEDPYSDFSEVTKFLSSHGYELQPVDDVEDFVVAIKQYTSHPENIFKSSVIQGQTPTYNCFLLKDQAAVEQAVYEGATKYTEIDIEWPF